MKNSIIYIVISFILCSCNSITVKPGTMDAGTKVYAPRGGYTMRRSIKDELERRGYDVHVGRATRISDNDEVEYERYSIPKDVRYIVKVSERREYIRPVWCAFNGFWWWNFNVSISEHQTGKEIMTWRGRGCADSSMRKLRKTLDKLENANDQRKDK